MILRLPLILLVALSINAGLFALMHRMVSRDGLRILDLVDTRPIEFVMQRTDEQTQRKDRRTPPPKPKIIDRPRPEVANVLRRATATPDYSADYEIQSLLAQNSLGVGPSLASSFGSELGLLSANDLIPLSMMPPAYPPAAENNSIEGWVDLIFQVNKRGQVDEAWVTDSSPARIFDRAATEAVRRWRFKPVKENGEAVDALRQVRILFSLDQPP